ncbi:MAG: glycosyltransferase family 4 protein [Bacteroidia bacterium]|nr:glycosyltransferase family 4 protein [Bacteroidia bacterium]
MKNKPRVLMLGWEFPPVINGGLGVACHDLCMAMSEYARVTMIIPKSNPDFKVRNLELIGIDTIDTRTLKYINHIKEYSKLENVHFVDSNLDPYYSSPEPGTIHGEEIKSKYIREVEIEGQYFSVFSIDDLYGGDVIEKVQVFGKIASRIATNMEFDVIHAHDWMTMIAGMEIKAKTGKPLVMHIHSLEIDRGGAASKGWVYQLEKKGMETADVLMPVSHFTAQVIKEHYHIPENKIWPVHNGIRPVEAYRSKKPYDEKMVLFVGRLTRQKGPEFFLEIAARVLERYPEVRFVMAGQGDSFQQLLEKSAFKNIGHRFHLTGFLSMDKVHQMLSMADVYCMPSVSEPFGLSAVEAAQFGVPVVISKQSGVAEVLKHALKFDFWDIDRAAQYIVSLLFDEVLCKKVVEDTNKDMANINWDNSAQKVIEGYAHFYLYNKEE